MASNSDKLCQLLLLITLFSVSVLPAKSGNSQPNAVTLISSPSCDEDIVNSVQSQCKDPSSVKSLDDFYSFYENFDHLTNKCLMPKSNLMKPSESSQLAESECTKNNLLYNQVRHLAQLVIRWRERATGPVCTINFATEIYHYHSQIGLIKSELLSRMLRLLANSVAWRCRFTLAKRIKNIQARAPESYKWVLSILTLMKQDDVINRLKPFAQVEQFVPILERELPENTFGLKSSSYAREGYEIKSGRGIDSFFEVARGSCKTLKPYHVNVLGSLGLLASLGYASPSKLDDWPALRVVEKSKDHFLVQQWLLSALICQSLRTVTKMDTTTTEGESKQSFKIMSTQETDVAQEEELDSVFAEYRLEEKIKPEVESMLADERVVELFSSYNYDAPSQKRANVHKLNLLGGPNYPLASAIETYLDLTKTDRFDAFKAIVGFDLEFWSDDELTKGAEKQ